MMEEDYNSLAVQRTIREHSLHKLDFPNTMFGRRLLESFWVQDLTMMETHTNISKLFHVQLFM